MFNLPFGDYVLPMTSKTASSLNVVFFKSVRSTSLSRDGSRRYIIVRVYSQTSKIEISEKDPND